MNKIILKLKLKYIILNCLFFTTIFQANAQTLKTWMDDNGLYTIGKLAHFATPILLDESRYEFLPDRIRAYIKYDLGYVTIVDVHLDNGVFSYVEVISESHWFPTFDYVSTLATMENSNTENVKDPRQKSVRLFYENYYKKQTNQFNKFEFATGILYFSWINHFYNNINDKPQSIDFGTMSESSMFDEITINGSKHFRENVKDALQLIKDYDSYVYSTFFSGKSESQIVKRIVINTGETYSTIGENVILLSPSFNTKKTVFLQVATTIIHELTHLHQFERNEYRKLFGISHDLYVNSFFAHSPKSIAEAEIEANRQAKRFLSKFKNNVRGKALISRMLKNIDYRISNYEYLLEANDLLNMGKRVEACAKIKLFTIAAEQKEYLNYYYNCDKKD